MKFRPFAGLRYRRNLYGTTDQGGTPEGSDLAFGTVFELKTEAGGRQRRCCIPLSKTASTATLPKPA
jgi:hypothetical protein